MGLMNGPLATYLLARGWSVGDCWLLMVGGAWAAFLFGLVVLGVIYIQWQRGKWRGNL